MAVAVDSGSGSRRRVYGAAGTVPVPVGQGAGRKMAAACTAARLLTSFAYSAPGTPPLTASCSPAQHCSAPALQVILEALDTHLVVFSPYLSLTKVLESDCQLADLGQNAWAALNDVYRTDAPITYAPHVLVLGCLYLASVICSRDITAWLETVDVDTGQVR